MMRDALNNNNYWTKWMEFEETDILDRIKTIALPSKNPTYRPQYVKDLAFIHLKLSLYRYSRGDPVAELIRYFEPLLHYWEESERLGLDVWTPVQQHYRHAWAVNLDHYVDCFWLVGLALALDIPEAQWQRLLALIGNEGEDILLDRIIATRQSDRKIGTSLCYPKPYQRLLTAMDAPRGKQAELLNSFVEHWYEEIGLAARSGRQKQAVPYEKPYWHRYHSPMKGAYFGYWCIEAVAAVKAFKLNDSLCLGHPHYPGDLLRPEQVTLPDKTRLPILLTKEVDSPSIAKAFEGTSQNLSTWQAFKMVVKNKFKP